MSLTKLRRNMSKAVRPIMYIIAAVFFASCFTLYWPWSPRVDGADAPIPVVARVNGEDVPRDLYERGVTLYTRQLDLRKEYGSGEPTLRDYHLARGQGFEAAVDSVVRAQAAEKAGITVSNSEVRAAIDDEIKMEMERSMEGATPQERRQYESQLRALASSETVRRRLLMDRLNEKLRQEFTPTEADLMNSYKEVKLRHILIKTDKRSDAEARRIAEDLLPKARTGDFAALARQHSEDPGSKNVGGDLDWVTANSSYVPEFVEAARALKKGEVSGLVKTMYGYHILKAEDVRTKLPKDIQDPKKKEEYFETFKEQTISKRMEAFFANLRLQAKIDPIDPWVAGYVSENLAISTAADEKGQAEAQRLYAQAIKHYERAAARNDLSAGAPLHMKLAELYSQTGQAAKALPHITKALEAGPSAELYLMEGEAYEQRKEKESAIKSYQEAMKYAEKQPWLYIQLQQKFKSLGRKDLEKLAYNKWEKIKNSGKVGGVVPATGLPPLPFPTGG